MILLALLLLTLGAADLVRPQDAAAGRVAIGRAVATGGVVAALVVWGTGLPWWWVAVVVALLVGWVVSTPVTRGRGRTHPWPVVALGVVALAMVAGSAHVPSPDGWLTDWYATLEVEALDGVPFTRFALGAAYGVFLVDSANIIVRMVLSATDAGVIASERTLKGGRVLGPIERIFIAATALAGAYPALAAVVAAKGILRFPEISRDTEGTKAEYVLVGSFVSWSLALVLLPLL